ncbi:dienelactone hydrolase family protein [Oricola sp.]|uniref:dienelactone hydrolase family protein n=1 Tax=Oricola sp. TaxID=1979950 RepID=UPI003BABF59F
MSNQIAVDGFEIAQDFAFGPDKTPVYVSAEGEKPLIVLHELPGMSPSFIDYSRSMSRRGFRVYMPLLFKQPGTEMSASRSVVFCMSGEFKRLFDRAPDKQDRPFTQALLQLIEDVAAQQPDCDIGVIGMCLTGGFALAGIASPNVSAAVACQPSYPFFSGYETLGLSDELRAAIRARGNTLPKPCARLYRYSRDRISREPHASAAEELLGDAIDRFPDLDGSAHSTLTGKSISFAVFDDVEEFLNARL